MVAEFVAKPERGRQSRSGTFSRDRAEGLLESSQVALLDTRFGEEQTGAEFSGAVERLQERQKRKRHDALIAKRSYAQEHAEMLELTGQLYPTKEIFGFVPT